MKSLAERLTEKKARLAREEKKLSGPVVSFKFAVPLMGAPYINKPSDREYIKGRAALLVTKIRTLSDRQMYEALKEAINAEEKLIAERSSRRAWWDERVRIGSIEKYIVVVKDKDGNLKDEHGNIWKPNVPVATPASITPTPEQLFTRVNDLDRRTRELQEQTPTSVERAQRLLEDAGNLEVDIQEVLTQLVESDLETPDDTDEMLTVVQQTFDNPTSPPVNELLNNLPTSGEALSHTVEESSDLIPEQEDAVVQPSIDHIRPLSRSARRRRNIVRQAITTETPEW